MADATTAYPVTTLPNPIAGPGGTPVGGTPAGGMDPLIALLTGGLNLGTASSDLGYGKEAAGMADPWASQRGQYQTGLNSFMNNPANSPMAAIAPLLGLLKDPSSVTKMPGYQFGMDQALGAVNRGAGASGLLNSGNRLLALQNQGQAYAGTWMDRMFNMLSGTAGLQLGAQKQGFGELADLAGVNAGSPAAAGQLFQNGVTNRGNALTGGASGILTGLAGILGGNSPAYQAIAKLLGGTGGGSGGGLTGNLDTGGINAGTLDPGGSLGDLQSGDFGGGSGGDWFTGGGGDMFQLIDPIGG